MIAENLDCLKFEYGGSKRLIREYYFAGGVILRGGCITVSFPAEGFEAIEAEFKHCVIYGAAISVNGGDFGKFHYTHFSQTADEICFSLRKN